MKKEKLNVKGTEISVYSQKNDDYICITDIARYKNPDRKDDLIRNWLRNRNTIEFLGIWEQLNNPDFKPVEFDGFRKQAGLNSFTLTPKQWIEKTNSIGIISKQGRYGGTYAHKDIAFEFAAWISVEFKLYLIKEFQRLKSNETIKQRLEWNVSRTLAKVNYLVHTDAVKKHLIPKDLSKSKQKFVYANEADLLNIALFNINAAQWRSKNKNANGNIRDFATIEQLVVLSNLENFNSEFIKKNIDPETRLKLLNKIAIDQMKIMIENKSLKKLK